MFRDPSLRRLLDASRNSDIPSHWQIQKRHEIRDQEVLQAMAEVERRAGVYARLLGSGFDEQKRPGQLEEDQEGGPSPLRRVHRLWRLPQPCEIQRQQNQPNGGNRNGFLHTLLLAKIHLTMKTLDDISCRHDPRSAGGLK